MGLTGGVGCWIDGVELMGSDEIKIPEKRYFKIGEVAELSGVKPYVLRYWETEFPFSPKKSKTGQRLYRKEDIEKVLEIRRLLYDDGFTIAGARRHLTQGEDAPETSSESRKVPENKIDRVRLLKVQAMVQELRESIQSLRKEI